MKPISSSSNHPSTPAAASDSTQYRGARSSSSSSTDSSSSPVCDLVAQWTLPLSDSVHNIQFEHGTTTGKRVIRVDGKTLMQKDWMFKLVGNEEFSISGVKCQIQIRANGFSYDYTLMVDGKPLKDFKEKQEKLLKTWMIHSVGGKEYRICLERESLDIWVNGSKAKSEATFADEGTEFIFELEPGFMDDEEMTGRIRTVSSGNKREGIIYTLIYGGNMMPE